MELDFAAAVREKFDRINTIREMVLSTCAENQVTSRVVSVACFDDKVYFLSWKHHTKCLQIASNPLVSFCWENLQMSGSAVARGTPGTDGTATISDLYKWKQPAIYRLFSAQQGMIILEATITRIKSWEQTPAGYYIDSIDLPNRKAWRLRPNE